MASTPPPIILPTTWATRIGTGLPSLNRNQTDVTAVIGFFCNQSTCGRHASPVLSLQMNPELVFFKRNANRAGTAKPRSLSDSTDFCIPLRHAQSRHIPQRCSSRVFHEHFACSGLEGLAQNLILTPFLWFRNRQRADNGRYVGFGGNAVRTPLSETVTEVRGI